MRSAANSDATWPRLGQREPAKYNIVYLLDGLGNGGAERLMVPMLAHLDRKRFVPRVCVLQDHCGNPVANAIRALDIPVDMIFVPYLRDLTAIGRIRRYLRESSADLVHTQLDFSDILGNLSAKLLTLPSVSTIHTFPCPERKFKSRARQKLVWACQRGFCDRVIAVSEIVRKHYLQVSGLPSAKTVTLYNGIDLRKFAAITGDRQEMLRRYLGIPLSAPLIITVAMLRPQKGIQDMIEALPIILENVPDANYLVVGDGPHSTHLMRQAKKRGVEGRVIFTGLRQDIPDLLGIGDLFVLPSKTEALPTVLAEAMAVGKPVVATDVGGVSEMIDHGRNGLLVSPNAPAELARACVTLLKNPARMKAMGRCGRDAVERKFNIGKQISKLESLYEKVLREFGG